MKTSYLDINGRHSVKIEMGKTCAVHEAEAIRQEMKAVYSKEIYHVLFDLTNCEFIDSTGLGMLVSVHKECSSKNGKMVLFKPTKEVRKLLNMTRLDQVFELTE